MDVPPPRLLIERFRALPAAAPVLARLRNPEGVHLVGGAVRDLLLGLQPKDLDFVVEGDAAAVAARVDAPVRTHGRFGTASLHVGEFTYDFATARRESYAHPGALPDVSPAALEEDLLRRDFTVNAIALALDGEQPGALRAAPDALSDLEARRLRILHGRSFEDDPTRLLRLARYSARLRFEIEPHTLELVRSAIAAGALDTVSGPRIGTELRLLTSEPDPVSALLTLRELGLDRAIDPGLGLDDADLARRALALLPGDGRPELVVLALAMNEIDARGRFALADRLGFGAAEREVLVAAGPAPAVAQALAQAESPSAIAAAAKDLAPEVVAIAGALGAAGPARAWLQALRHVQPRIRGTDLLKAGIPAGPAIGLGLEAALRASLDGRAHTREEELAEALHAAREADR